MEGCDVLRFKRLVGIPVRRGFEPSIRNEPAFALHERSQDKKDQGAAGNRFEFDRRRVIVEAADRRVCHGPLQSRGSLNLEQSILLVFHLVDRSDYGIQALLHFLDFACDCGGAFCHAFVDSEIVVLDFLRSCFDESLCGLGQACLRHVCWVVVNT